MPPIDPAALLAPALLGLVSPKESGEDDGGVVSRCRRLVSRAALELRAGVPLVIESGGEARRGLLLVERCEVVDGG